MQPGRERGEGEDAEEYPLVLGTGPFEPRRHHGYDEVEADERIHKPQMNTILGKVEEHHLQLLYSLVPCQFAPQSWRHRIEHQKADEWRQNA